MYRERKSKNELRPSARERTQPRDAKKETSRRARAFFSRCQGFSENVADFSSYFLSYSLAREWKISEGRMRNSK